MAGSSTALVFRMIGIDQTGGALRSASAGMTRVGNTAALVAGVVAGASLKLATDWEFAMTRVVTGADEPLSKINEDSDAMLGLMGRLGMTSKQMAAAFYDVSSAGFHAGDALKILEVTAKGARVGGAELPVVMDAMTTALNAFNLTADDSTRVMNGLIGAEVYGKATMQELANALPNVAAAAHAGGISFEETAAALAAMTAKGIQADNASTYLRFTIGFLSNPTLKARKAMQGLGLDALEVSKNMGEKGLGSTINMLYDAMMKKLTPAGTVLVDKLKAAAGSSSDFETALSQLQPAEKTQLGAIADMAGGIKSLQAVLALGGGNAARFAEISEGVADRAATANGEIVGWAEAQDTLKFKMDALRGSLESIGIMIGERIIPHAKKLVDRLRDLTYWATENKGAFDATVTVLGTLATAYLGVRAAIAAVNLVLGIYNGLAVAARAATRLLKGTLLGLAGGWWLAIALAIAAGLYLIWEKTDWLQSAWGAIWSKIKGAAEAVGDWFTGTLVPAIRQGVDWLSDKLDGLFAWVEGPGAQMAASGFDAIRAGWERLCLVVSAFRMDPSGTISTLLDIAMSLFMTGLRAVVDRVRELQPLIVEKIKQWGPYVGVALMFLGPILIAALVKLGTIIAPAIVQFARFIAPIILDQLRQLPGRIIEILKILGPLLGTTLLSIGQAVIGMAPTFFALVLQLFGMIGSAVLGFIAQVPGWALGIIGQVPGMMAGMTGFILGALVGLFGKIAAITLALVVMGIAAIGKFIATAVAKLPGMFLSFIRRMGELAGNVISGIASVFDGGIGGIVGKFQNIKTQIIVKFVELAQGALEAGKNVIGGLINGIKSAMSGLLNLAKELANRFLDGFKNGMGIFSPSKEMAKLGVFTVEGYIVGLDKMRATLAGSAVGLTSTVLTGVAPGGSAAPAMAMRTVPGGSAGTERAPEPTKLEVVGERQMVEFFRSLVRRYGGGDVQIAFGGRR